MSELFQWKDLRNTLAVLDADEYPETYDYLTSVLEPDEEKEPPELLRLASDLLEMDKETDMAPVIKDLIISLYSSEFQDGNADAFNDLGALYYEGTRGFEQDYAKAFFCYTQAAAQGSRQAQENLGYCYYYGRSVPVDYEKAFQYYAMGALDGHLISLYKIGDMYLNGYYVEKNEKEAFSIYNHCVDLMNDDSAKYAAGPVFLRLGKCYLYGMGTERNAKGALVCYQKAELFLYDMVSEGERMYLPSLKAAIRGTEDARKELLSDLEYPAE